MKKNLQIRISGDVHGVGFRWSARRKAEELGICGWIRNELDGTVGAEIEGEKNAVNEFINWCKSGPEFASVEKIDISEGEVRNYSDFEIR